jgi:surfeit locus 1 family protein
MMRSFYFRPQPVLTLITVIALAILIKLGFWQKARLEWKTELLASVQAAAIAPPLTSSTEIMDGLASGEFIEFRRVDLKAKTAAMETPFLVFTARNRDISWRKFQLIKDGPTLFFADMGVVADDSRDDIPKITADSIRLIGYIRTAEWQEEPRSESSPKANRWFGFNPLPDENDWGYLSGGGADMRFFIETVPGAANAESLPPKEPMIANNHFDYMLTWFALAIILCVFYVLIHIRDGRAGRRS